jgi:HEAT repeat protein
MRQVAPLGLFVMIAMGCGKKPEATAPEPEPAPVADVQTPAEPPERDRLLAAVKTKQGDARRKAAEAVAALAASDPAIVDALVELLRDPATAGPGRSHPTAITSTREAAAFALLWCGPKGEEALKEKGLPVLREGLSSRDPAIREHTAHTLGKLGEMAAPLAAHLQRLCKDEDENVRSVAFDSLRSVGVADPAGIAALLNDSNPDVRRRAAEAFYLLTEVPESAVGSLTRALDGDDEVVRLAAATGIAVAGPKAATPATARKLADAINKSYPEEYNPETAVVDGPEFTYWIALGRLGKPAVVPTTDLLAHKNMLVRMLAVRTLGELGDVAKESAPAVGKLLTDPLANVALEAVVTLCRFGDRNPDIDGMMKAALASTNPGVAAAAVAAVPRMGDRGRPYLPEVVAKLGSPMPDVRWAAAAVVGTMEPAEAAKQVPALAKLAIDDEPLIRSQVGQVLEKLGPAAAPAAAVGRALIVEMNDLVREDFVAALIAMGPEAKPAVPGLLPLAGDNSISVMLRTKVIRAVAVADPRSSQVANALVHAAADPDISIRMAAARAMGKLNPLPDEARTALVNLARDDREARVRWAAVRGLADAGPRATAAKPELEAIATGKLPGINLLARVAVQAINGDVRKAGGAVRAALTDRNVNMRMAGAEALLMVGPAPTDVPVLARLLREGDMRIRLSAATALGIIGEPAKEAVPRLTDLLADGEAEVRLAAAEALGRIGPAALPAATKLKEAAKAEPAIEPTVRKALAKIGVKDDAVKK